MNVNFVLGLFGEGFYLHRFKFNRLKTKRSKSGQEKSNRPQTMSVVRLLRASVQEIYSARQGSPASMGCTPSRVSNDSNDGARSSKERTELRSSNNLSSLPNRSCDISIKVAFKLCPCVPHPIGSDARFDGRCAGRLFHHHNIDRRSII
jgi:hypothetical protein